MKLTGKLIHVDDKSIDLRSASMLNDVNGTIELPPVDTSKLKIGDEVLVKMPLRRGKVLDEPILEGKDVRIYNIVAVLPSTPEPEPVDWEKIKLKDCPYGHSDWERTYYMAKKHDELVDLVKSLSEEIKELRAKVEGRGK